MGKEILIASDHAGFPLKEHIKNKFHSYSWKDLGTFEKDHSVDYPDYASKLALCLTKAIELDTDNQAFGVLICKSGQGMAMTANKFPFIRAAICWSEKAAKLSREHNDSNLLCLSENLVSYQISEKILSTFLTTDFLKGRHQKRVEKIKKLKINKATN